MLFRECAEVFEKLESISKRLEMTSILADFFRKVPSNEIQPLIYMIQGILSPPFLSVELGLGERFAISAIASSAGYPIKEVEKNFAKSGDLGKTAESLLEKKKQLSLSSRKLDLIYLYNSLVKIAKTSGAGSQELKIKLLTELLNNSTPLESRFIIRFVIGELRLGVGDPTILDALSVLKAGDKSLREELDRAYNICADLGLVAKIFMESSEQIKHFKVKPFNPLIPALAERLSNSEEIINKIGKCAVENKFDGLRLQCHKKGELVEIYSRKLEKMTHMFPDLVKEIKSLKQDEIIFEGEALAFNKKQDRYFSFQETIRRRRKHGIEESSKEFPLNLFVFDIFYIDGRDLTKESYTQRRKYLEQIFPTTLLKLSENKIVSTAEEMEILFQNAIKENLEGIMAKDLNSPYTAGKRKFAWIKLKKSYGKSVDTIDAVIVGYYLGKGSRAKFKFGGVLTAIHNPDSGKFETIANIGSGFTEEEMNNFEKILNKIKSKKPSKNLIFKTEPDFWVKPKYVVEIAFDEITQSPTHTCGMENDKGYALRFPRIVKLREDRSENEVTTTKEIIDMYWLQFKNKK
ncbi:MAG: ATP-dependent DNA ligase [Candidatus ainarchaeum sp.]|nr:ATP-dependent DNA ligase [Candidatus ainarchaeum sp.]